MIVLEHAKLVLQSVLESRMLMRWLNVYSCAVNVLKFVLPHLN